MERKWRRSEVNEGRSARRIGEEGLRMQVIVDANKGIIRVY